MKVFLPFVFLSFLLWSNCFSYILEEERGQKLCEDYFKGMETETTDYDYQYEGMQAENVTIADEFSKAELQDAVGRFIERFQIVSDALGNLTGNPDECKGNYKKIGDRTELYGFGVKPDCTISRDKNSIEKLKGDEQSLIDDIIEIKNKGEALSPSILNSYRLPWKNKGYINDAYAITDERIVSIRKCDAYRALGIRVNGTWGFAVSYYRDNENFNAGKYQRIWLTEFITKNGVNLSQLHMSTPQCTGSHGEKVKFTGVQDATATKHRDVSLVKWDHFQRSTEHVEEHAGMEPAIEAGDRHAELLQDSSAASNIAILLLPGLLTLFPIGLFDDASLKTLIIFSLATDILSVLPIIIKGSEMIHYGRKEYFGNEIRFHGSIDDSSGIAIVQFLPAKCSFKSSQLRTGIILLAIGLLLMTMGLSLEYWSIRRVQKKKEEDEDHLGANYGLLYYWNKDE